MANLLSSLVSPRDVRALVRANSSYVENRDRVGALAHDGLAALEAYDKARPFIFVGSLIGAAASAWALWKRKKKATEAIVLYSTTFTVCAATAWLTKPGGAPGAEVAPEPGQPSGGMLGYLDRRVAKLKAADPDFADRAIQRVVELPALRPQWDKLDPIVQAVVL